MFVGIDPTRSIQLVEHSRVIAFDVETTGVDISSVAIGYVVTDDEASIYTPVRHSGGGNIPNSGEFERVLSLAFADRARRGHRTVGHNLGFDLRMAAKHGIRPEYPLEDTMINEGLICDITRGYGLDDCCNRYNVAAKLGDTVYRHLASKFGGIPDRKQMAHFHRLAGDDPIAVDYACGDGISTLELWRAQQKLLDEEQLRKPWELECKLIHRVARIHRRGLRIDAEYGKELMSKGGLFDQQISEAQAKFPPGFNVNSPNDVERLFREAGYQDSDFAQTETGKPSFREGWLKTNELGENIIAVRQLRKARDAFATPLVETHNIGGRVFPTLNQSKSDEYGAIGARFSCSEPNLQAFPKRNRAVGKIVRRLVIADDGYEVQEGDAKQQEPRLFAYFSEDERLLDGYGTGALDLHDLTSAGLGLDRDTAKRMGMGLLTGMSAKTLAGHMKMSLADATHYHTKFFEQFPKILAFHSNAKSIFRNTGYVRSILGRRARLDDPKYCYRAISRIIQNSGGDHIKTCLLRACEYEEAHPEVQILLTIHDSVMWQRQLGFDTAELVKAMENVSFEPDFNLPIPIPFEVGTGLNWATASYSK